MSTEQSPLLSNEQVLEPESLSGPQATNSKTQTHGSYARVSAFDLTRGLICLLMAIDHTFFFSGKEHPTESYRVVPDGNQPYLASWYHYGLRFVTHTCAPGFFILMGLGTVYFVDSRVNKAGWSLAKTAKSLVVRGLLFMVVGYVSILPFRSQFHVRGWLLIDVIFSLGFDFVITGMLVLAIKKVDTPRLSTAITASVGILAGLLACLTIFLADYKNSEAVQIFWLSGGDEISWYMSRFPPLSWLPLAIYGIFYGRLNQKFSRWTAPLSLLMAGIFFLLFLAVRIPGKWGNLTPVSSNWFRSGVKEFFWTNKYCPDLAYITLFTCIDHLFISIFAMLPKEFPGLRLPGTSIKLNTNQVLLDIGTSPFAFYFAHFYSLIAISITLRSLGLFYPKEKLGPGYSSDGLGNGWAYWCIYLLFAIYMWLVCRAYGRFKSSKPVESAWRYF